MNNQKVKYTAVSDILKDWRMTRLGEIREEMKLNKAPINTIPYIEIGDIDVNNKNIFYKDKGTVAGAIFCPENSILISRVRPTRGAIAFVNNKIAVSSAFTVIKPEPFVNTKLLFYFLGWNCDFYNYLGSKQKGTNYPSVRESDILEFQILLPTNPIEQQKIVYVLDNIQKAVRVQEKIIERTKELKKSLMKQLFTQGTRGAKLKKTALGEIPENWEAVKLGEVSEFQYGFTATATDKNTGVKFLRITDIKEDGSINWATIPYCDIDSIPTYQLKDGDVLFARIGATTGKTSFLVNPPKGVFASYLIRANIQRDRVQPSFLFHYTHSTYYWSQIEAQREGKLKKGINATELRKFLFPLPPFSEQQEIAEILQTIDQKIEIEQKKKILYEELFKAMLNQLMTGKIRVKGVEFEEK